MRRQENRKQLSNRKQGAAKQRRGVSARRSNSRFNVAGIGRFSVRVAGLSCFLLSFGAIAYFGFAAMDNARQRPIQSVKIEGPFHYVTQDEVAVLLQPIIVDGFLQIPLMSVKQKLEQHPWIATVNVSRRWPDALLIVITEQQAIARWSNTGFLNQHGDIIVVEQTPVLAALPWLDGSVEEAKVLMQRYQQFAQLLRPHGMNITTFQADATNDMTVTLNNGLVLYLGKDQVLEKFQRFLLVLQHSLKTRLADIATVDLRYSNGLAVQWQPGATEVGENRVADSGLSTR